MSYTLFAKKYFTAGAATHTGLVRHENQDAWCCMPGAGLFAVSDGMGGGDGGYASEEARRAAGVTSGWKATGGYLVDGVIDNGDGTYRENDIYVNPETYWLEVSRSTPELFIYDNSYIKCRELTLTLDFPKNWLDKKGIVKHVGISFVARNPFIVWKNIKDIDPDAQYNTSGLGLEYGSLPSRRSYGLNFNIKF